MKCPACVREEQLLLAERGGYLSPQEIANIFAIRYPEREGRKVRLTPGRYTIAKDLHDQRNACSWHLSKALRVGRASVEAMIVKSGPTPRMNVTAWRLKLRLSVACPTCSAAVGHRCAGGRGFHRERRALWPPGARGPTRSRHV